MTNSKRIIRNGQNTPAALEHVEIAGINQARALGVCTFNEFRKFLNLTTLETFEDFSEKPSVQQALKELYGTPDRVELYAGLMVERTKVTGSQLPYTIGRAIISDAANLLRNGKLYVIFYCHEPYCFLLRRPYNSKGPHSYQYHKLGL